MIAAPLGLLRFPVTRFTPERSSCALTRSIVVALSSTCGGLKLTESTTGGVRSDVGSGGGEGFGSVLAGGTGDCGPEDPVGTPPPGTIVPERTSFGFMGDAAADGALAFDAGDGVGASGRTEAGAAVSWFLFG